MNEPYRGGNSRALARSFDQMQSPIAVLDRRGSIVFVNQAMCRLVSAEASQLTGQQCSWQIAEDSNRFGPLLTALAPPAGALQGKVIVRQLTVPIVFGSTATGQLFVPVLDEDLVPHLTMVILGEFEQLQTQAATKSSHASDPLRRNAERTLVELRSRWSTLDQLLPLVGDSPAIRLAMARAQLAISAEGNCLISGPSGTGKSQLASSIFVGRLRRLGLPRVSGHWLPLDCSALVGELFEAMLDVFSDRLRENLSAAAQMLVLKRVEALDAVAVAALVKWLSRQQTRCTVCAITSESLDRLTRRGEAWPALLAQLAQFELMIPPLNTRVSDIAIIAQHLLSETCRKYDRAQLNLAPSTLDLLTIYPWPDNLRQLASTIEAAVQHAVLTSTIHPQHLPVEIRTYPSTVHQVDRVEPIVLDDVLLELEKTLIQRAIQLSPRNRAQVARLLGISRPRLLRRLEQLGIDTVEEHDAEPE